MTKTIENLFVYLATFSSLLPILLFFLFYNKIKKERLLQIILAYSFFELFTNILTFFLTMKGVIFTYFIFTNIEYILFAFLFYFSITNKTFKKIIAFGNVLFLIFSISYFLLTKYQTFDSIPIGVETILILFFAFYYLYEQMESTSQTLIYDRFAFWLIAGIMIYLAGSFFIYIFTNNVDIETRHFYWMFTNVFTIIKNVLFAIGILIFKTTSKSKSTSNYKLN